MQTWWRIELFGGVRARSGEAVISRFYSRTVGNLLAYLALNMNRAHSREELADLFWPDAEPASGRLSLRVGIAALRRQLEPPGVPRGGVLIATDSSISLNALHVTTADFYAGMKAAGKTSHQETLPAGGVRTANLVYNAGPGNFTGLCPGIQYMYIKEQSAQLVIVGDFGSVQGTVTINGTAVGTTWSTSQITCDIPTDPTAPTFSGPVIVSVNGHMSNQVTIIKYVGDVHYEHDDKGTLVHSADMHLIYRADVHPFRRTPFADPIRPPGGVGSVSASTFKYNSTGENPTGGVEETWTGSGTLPNGAYASGGDIYTSSIQFVPASNQAQFSFNFHVTNGFDTKIGSVDEGYNPLAPDNAVYTSTTPYYVGFTIDSSLNIQPYQGPHHPLGSSAIVYLYANFTETPIPDNTKQEDDSSD